MKLKITRIFCVFLLIVASTAFALLFTLLAEEETAFDQAMWFGLGGCVLVSVGYAVLLLNSWANADRLLAFAGVYAVVLLLVINVLGVA